MLYEQADLLCVSLRKQLDQNGVAEMRTNFTAWATDVISILAFPKPLHLLEDYQEAVDYHLMTKAAMLLTPLQKQFPWLVETAVRLPLALAQIMSPDLARSVVLYKVRPKPFLVTPNTRANAALLMPIDFRTCLNKPRKRSAITPKLLMETASATLRRRLV